MLTVLEIRQVRKNTCAEERGVLGERHPSRYRENCDVKVQCSSDSHQLTEGR